MDDTDLTRLIAIGGAVLGAAWALARELKRRRDQHRQVAALRSALPSEKEALEIILKFEARHRRYQAAVVAAIAGFALMVLAALPDFGIVGIVAIPLVFGGFVVGIEAYKCPRCGEPPVRSWRLRAPTYPRECGKCGTALRRPGGP